ncbi:Alpha/Beta hydrolase protein [Aspergillus karnatakaensis]|uniref:alpha/beta hydrolase n=1 Tax=Aspergillus karnatakaensis TaxID=1810916 RepID=UPI003CCDD745
MIPKTAPRSTLDPEISTFTSKHPDLRLGGENLLSERRIHSQIFNFTSLPPSKQAQIGRVEFTALRGPHGTIPIRVLYPSIPQECPRGTPALIYFHGGGYTVGSADEFENGCRILAERAGVQVYLVEYRLAPEWKYPTQLDEYEAVLVWVRGEGGRERGVDPDLVIGGGDSAGGNMTAALSLRLRDDGKKEQNGKEKWLTGVFLLYPEARVPFDTPAAVENNGGPYLVCNGIFEFARNYVPAGVPPSIAYISPGMQPVEDLKGLPPAVVYTCGFDCLRDVGVEYASKLEEAGNQVTWHHYETLSHGFLQMAPWSNAAMNALLQVAQDVADMVKKARGP